MSNLNQRQVQKLLQKLSPQQIQMIKLLELPALHLEPRIKQEIEENPVLEEEPSEDQEEEQPKSINSSVEASERVGPITSPHRKTTRAAPSHPHRM